MRRNFDGEECDTVGIYDERYMGFDGGIGPTRWLDMTYMMDMMQSLGPDNRDNVGMEVVDRPTIEFEEDKAAYEKLMIMVNARR
jgi:hypothetical protein